MRLITFLLAATAVFAQSFPGSIYTPLVAGDNIATTLSAPMAAGDSVAVVASSSDWVANMMAYVCDGTTTGTAGKCTGTFEVMKVTGVVGNVISVTRGQGGTSAVAHAAGKAFSNSITSIYTKTVNDEVLAIETTLGTNLGNVRPSPFVSPIPFGPITSGSGVSVSGGNLVIGSNVLTFSTVPIGVNGTDTNHPLYVSGGSGTAESCTVSGGSGTSGSTNGQIIVTCSNTHSGAWTIQSATAGIVEAMYTLGSRGGIIQMLPGIFPIYYPGITITRDNVIIQGQGGWSPSELCHPESGGYACLGSSTIQATGAWSAGSYMFTFDGSGQARKFLNNPGMRDLDLDANGVAGGHIHVKQVNGGDFYKLHLHDHTNVSGASYSFYFESTNTSTAVTGSTCGNNGGFLHLGETEITSYRAGAAGIQLGTPGTTYDVCSNRFVNVTIATHNVPGAYGLYLANTDSNEFSNIFIEGDNTGKAITSIAGTGTTTATITVPGHGLPPGTAGAGVSIFNACSIALVAGSCGGTEIKGLEGPFAATYVDANTLSITGAFGIANLTTYYAQVLYGADVEFGGCANCGGNLFSTLTAVLFQEPGSGGYGNYLSGWNWITDGNAANPAYQRIGGTWINKIFAYGIGNFQSIPSVHGGYTQTSQGQVLLQMQDLTGANYAADQQAARLIYDGGANYAGGGFGFQGLTDALGYQSALFTIYKKGMVQIGKVVLFSALPACSGTYEGAQAAVSDSTTATWGATITGGSTNHVLGYCDGTSWTVMGK